MERNMEAPVEAEVLSSLQWGSTKRLRCVRLRQVNNNNNNQLSSSSSSRIRRKITSRFLTLPHPTRNSETATHRSEIQKSSFSPERYYSTRGGIEEDDKINRVDVLAGKLGENHNPNNINNKNGASGGCNKKLVWPKLSIGLSSKEKEEDFMAMKGCKLPQRPKKRAKVIQRTLLLVSPGAWLTDMCWERYEVREKKTGGGSSKKRGRGGLKALGGCVDSDSD